MVAHLGVYHLSLSSISGSTRQEEYNTYSEIADSHTKQRKTRKEKTIKSMMERRRTEQLLISFSLNVENPSFVL